ncbi:MAG: translation initiation factor IF-3 [Chloroflexota bacterium]
MNEQIRAREVRVIGDAGEQLGIMTVAEAVRHARERSLDLVEVAPTVVPPVCRLLDYGKFRYEQAKKEREARKHQHTIMIREVRFHPKIDGHDLDVKVKQAQRLLTEGDKVKISVLFRGREMTHPELGRGLLAKVADELKTISILEKPVEMEGRNMNIILAPAVQKAPKVVAVKGE